MTTPDLEARYAWLRQVVAEVGRDAVTMEFRDLADGSPTRNVVAILRYRNGLANMTIPLEGSNSMPNRLIGATVHATYSLADDTAEMIQLAIDRVKVWVAAQRKIESQAKAAPSMTRFPLDPGKVH